MMQPMKLTFFVLGAILMCLPGLFTAGMKWAFVVFLAVGGAILILATVKSGGSKPGTALTLLVASNASFWLSYGLWLTRLRFAGPSPKTGIEAFAGPVALWVIILLPFLLYEGVVFLRGLVAKKERATAAIGLVASAAQILITLRIAYGLVRGV